MCDTPDSAILRLTADDDVDVVGARAALESSLQLSSTLFDVGGRQSTSSLTGTAVDHTAPGGSADRSG